MSVCVFIQLMKGVIFGNKGFAKKKQKKLTGKSAAGFRDILSNVGNH